MPVHRLNHIVLYVSNAERTARFYREVLGFRIVHEAGGGKACFMQAPGSTNDHDLGLFEMGPDAGPSTAGRSTVGTYHVAWELDTLDELRHVATLLAERGALVGASDHGTTKALYAKDPDGLELEVSWLLPASAITDDDRTLSVLPLDLDKECARFGADTLGGVGVSRPVPV
ncbi:MAG: VOC family protein [Actinomycetota bacterium]|nr:VOC family protein [Actinomycetota bacterium]